MRLSDPDDGGGQSGLGTGTRVRGANAGGIASRMAAALSDPERTQAMGAVAYGFAPPCFSTGETLDIVTRLVGTARERTPQRPVF